jgi:hypothetical protein
VVAEAAARAKAIGRMQYAARPRYSSSTMGWR